MEIKTIYKFTNDSQHIVTICKTNRRRTSSLQVRNGKVRVLVPKQISTAEINNLIISKQKWIASKLKNWEKSTTHNNSLLSKQFKHGELWPFLGNNFMLKIHRNPIEKANETTINCIDIYLPSNLTEKKGLSEREEKEAIKKKLEAWYRSKAIAYLEEETLLLAQQLQLKPKKVSIRKYSQRWGSCNSKKEITYNWILIMAPKHVVHYVIVHELCHLLHMNHSKKFWNAVESSLPNFKTAKAWLHENEALLIF